MIGKRATLVSFIAVVTGLAATSCGTGGAAAGPPAFTLSSPDVTADGVVPDWAIGRFGGLCDGKNRSISLRWTDAPAATESFTVVMVNDSYTHWVITGIPKTATGFAATDDGRVSPGVLGQSVNGPGSYTGPCVAGNQYVYTVYALDLTINGNASTTIEDVRAAIEGHALAESSLTTQRP